MDLPTMIDLPASCIGFADGTFPVSAGHDRVVGFMLVRGTVVGDARIVKTSEMISHFDELGLTRLVGRIEFLRWFLESKKHLKFDAEFVCWRHGVLLDSHFFPREMASV